MKKTGWLFAALIIPVILGCQQAQQKKTADISRKDRLMANENLNLKSELVQCQSQIKKQEKLIEQYQQENKEMTNATSENQNLKREAAQCQREIEKQKQLLEQYQQMLDSKDDPALCRNKIERQKELLERCRQENIKIQTETGNTATFLVDQLPKDLMEQVKQLTQENEQLKAKIEEFQKAEKDINEVQTDSNGVQAQ
jgi:DNA repair exonuclease SbcCD ATPase subunit